MVGGPSSHPPRNPPQLHQYPALPLSKACSAAGCLLLSGSAAAVGADWEELSSGRSGDMEIQQGIADGPSQLASSDCDDSALATSRIRNRCRNQ